MSADQGTLENFEIKIRGAIQATSMATSTLVVDLKTKSFYCA